MAASLTLARLDLVGKIREFTVWFLLGYVAGGILWVVGPALVMGWSPTVVTSGSMGPGIRVGDVVHVDRHPDEIVAGDVVQFHAADGEFMLHRVVSVAADGTLRTKGDANAQPDSTPVPADMVTGRGVALVPYVLHPLSVAAVLIGAIATLAVRVFRSRGHARLGALAAAVVAVATFATVNTARAAFAATAATEESSVVTAGLPSPPALTATCGVIGLGSVPITLTWPSEGSEVVTHYEIQHRPENSPDFTVVATVPALVPPGDQSHVYEIPTVPLSVGVNRFRVVATGHGWSSAPSPEASRTITRVLGIYACL